MAAGVTPAMRLPSLKTAYLPAILRIGCTTCGPWATTALTAGDERSDSTSRTCPVPGSDTYSHVNWGSPGIAS